MTSKEAPGHEEDLRRIHTHTTSFRSAAVVVLRLWSSRTTADMYMAAAIGGPAAQERSTTRRGGLLLVYGRAWMSGSRHPSSWVT